MILVVVVLHDGALPIAQEGVTLAMLQLGLKDFDRKQIDGFEPQLNVTDIGIVVEAGDGIARVQGLESVQAQELVQDVSRQ